MNSAVLNFVIKKKKNTPFFIMMLIFFIVFKIFDCTLVKTVIRLLIYMRLKTEV